MASELVSQAADRLRLARQDVQLHASEPGLTVAKQYTQAVDETLLLLWNAVSQSTSPGQRPFDRAALVAQGGYGREELNLYSDIDVLVIIPEKLEDYEERGVQQFFHLLWDLHLDVGHATKTPKECLGTIGTDIDSATALIEARFLAGNRELYDSTLEQFERQLRNQQQRWFLEFRRRDWEERHAHYGASVYLLEPNVKQGEGGLRDVHTLRWLAYIFYGEASIEALHRDELISDTEYETLQECVDQLLRVRNYLHILEGRKCDVLSFEKQIRVADALGYKSDGQMLAEELFMRDYYSRARDAFRIGQHVVADLAEPKRRSWFKRDKVVEGAIRRRGDLVFIQGDEAAWFQEDPARIVQVFAVARGANCRVSDSTKRAIEQILADDFDGRVSTSEAARDAFLDILKAPSGAGTVLRDMHECGALSAYLPEFQHLTCMVRADSYHKYTVDEHSIIAVEVADRLREGDESSPDLLRREAEKVERWHLLNFAILLHDIGKGEGHGHVLRGGQITKRITARMDLPADEADVVRRLVTSHLKLTHVGLRRDLDDPKVINQMARDMGDVRFMRLLYILTYCDLRAVSPGAWTDWKSALLAELYAKTCHVLTGAEASVRWLGVSGDDTRQKVQAHLTASEDDYEVPLDDYISELPERYVATTSPKLIAHHYEMFNALDDENRVIWELRHPHGQNYSELTVLAYDRPGVFSILCGALASKRINILSAQVFSTSGGGVIDRFHVQDSRGEALPEGFVLERLRSDVNRIFCGRKSVDDLFKKAPHEKEPLAQAARERIVPPNVTIDNEGSDHSTIIEVKSYDRIGLLYDITRVFADQGLTIDLAMISTEAYRVVDVFYVTDSENNKVDDGRAVERLQKQLMEVISK